MALITVFLLGFIDIFLPLPVIATMDGFSMETAFLIVGLAGTAGSLFFIYGSRPIRRWAVRRYGMDSLIFTRTERFMAKYGTIGVGLLAPIILGHALTAVGAIVLGAPVKKLTIWMIAGVWIWTAIYYVALLMGLEFLG